MRFFAHKSSSNRASTPSLSPPSSAHSPQTFQVSSPSPSVRPNQGAPLVPASAGFAPPPIRQHSVVSSSQGPTVQLVGPRAGANVAEGIGIGVTTVDTSSYGRIRPQSAEPGGPAPSPSSLFPQLQSQSSLRKPLDGSLGPNSSYHDARGQQAQQQQQQATPHQTPQQRLGPPDPSNGSSANSGPPQGSSQTSSIAGSIGRRISLRTAKSAGSPHLAQYYHNSPEPNSSEHLEHYTHSPGASSRPQSMQPTTTPISIEEEPSNPSYLPQRSGTDVDSTQYQLHHPPQRQDSFRHHQPQQGIQSQSQQQPQQQLQPQQQYYQDQRRRSMENTNNPLQHAPLTRELSGQLQAMQPYANQQPGSPLPPPTPGQQQPYQQGGGPPSYDPNKFTDQPIGRMTPPLNPGGPQQQQQPQPQPQQQNQPSGQQQQGPHNNHGGVRTMDIQKLCEDYDSLQAKYRKVKNLYFERGNEIERLQNTLAHQRLAQSRTSLDDSEYASRFERLDGAIKNVAFEIRQCWKTIPPWLQPVTSHGAEIKGGREMTVVGRASISRWVVDEILEMFFHPGLDPSLSVHLKTIEQNIRRNHHDPQSIEEDDALSSKVCNWRLTTLDALRHELQGPLAAENKARLTQHLVEKLVASLQMHLREPSPPGLLGGVSMIVDIAIGLASNLPLESRDVRVWYPAPGVLFDGKFMKVEGQLPPLTPSISEGQQQQGGQGGEGGQGGDRSLMELDPQSNNNEENGSKDQSLKHSGSVNGPGQSSTSVQSSSSTRSEKISGPMTRMVKRVQEATGTGKSGHGQQLGQQQGPNQAGKGGSQINLGQQPSQGQEGQQSGPQGGNEESKTVRIAGFMAVEVRGRSILVKAPVWC